MALTHAAIATTGVVLALGDSSPLILGLTLLGSQVPDLDTSESLIGQTLVPLSRFLESRFPHRSVTHSFLATAAIALASLPLYFVAGWKYWAALPLAHLITCFSDTFTKQGVQLFWPSPVWCVCGSNPKRRITTGSPAEYWTLAFAIALLIVAVNITNSGGSMLKVTQTLGLKEGIERTYNSTAGNHNVYLQVEGARASDRTPINKKFFILGESGSQYVLMDEQGIYKISEQIVSTKNTIEIGENATTKTEQINFDDESPAEKLESLKASNPQALIVLSGAVTVDAPEDIKPNADINQYQTFKLSGESATLEFCPVEAVIALLADQFATGTLTAKIIAPVPRL